MMTLSFASQLLLKLALIKECLPNTVGSNECNNVEIYKRGEPKLSPFHL